MLDDPLITARNLERSIRQDLTEGCISDIDSIEILLRETLAATRVALEVALQDYPDVDVSQHPELAAAVRRIARDCIRRAQDTSNVRFRARFRSYAEAVWANESRLIGTPRRIAIPHLHVMHFQPNVPLRGRRDDFVEAWMADLVAQLHFFLRAAVEKGIESTVRRTITSTSRARTMRALRLLRSAER